MVGVGYGYRIYDKQKQELFKLKLTAINNKIIGIDTLDNELSTINPAIKLTLEDIKNQQIYLDTLEARLKNTKKTSIGIDSALKILDGL